MSSASSSNGQSSDGSTQFDPADPFSFLLAHSNPDNSSVEDSSSSSHNSPPDWSQFSNLWDGEDPVAGSADPATQLSHGQNVKFDASALDFAFPMPLDLDMEMEFNPSLSLSIDPSSLHFDPRMFASPTFAPQNPANPQQQMQFTSFPQPSLGDTDMLAADMGKGRRMSITSSSSSSGASFSPTMGHTTASSTSTSVSGDSPESPPELAGSNEMSVIPNLSDPAHELADRVRQAAGVTLAVPVHGQAQQQQLQSAFTFSSSSSSSAAQKLPIPRLPRPTLASTKRKSPSPVSPASSAPSSSVPSPSGPITSVIGRPKTSHTTIERRYRTNLNARIQSLKDAVPALRVLDRGKGKGKKEANADADAEGADQADDGDVVDERGYVDGVKVARKISKANVLGKAAEYIRVLKRRELRLLREQAGLRTLVSGLVGGPALLREWEREWVARFGGPERDEVDGNAAESDDEEEGESDDDEEEGRARKKAKSAAAAAKPKPKPKKVIKEEPSNPGVPGVVPEKRKRGRPRKVQPPMEGMQIMLSQTSGVVPPPVQPTQYLLAAFAFFSFFNSPLTSSSASNAHHAHSGTVLNPVGTAGEIPMVAGWGWRDAVQVFHLFVSALVLLSIAMPFLPSSLAALKAISMPAFFRLNHFKSNASSARPPAASFMSRISADGSNRVALIDALSPVHRGTPDEAARLRNALGVYSGLGGMLINMLNRSRARKDGGFERMQLEQRAWVRLGELAALNAKTPFGPRIQAYWGMRARTSAFAASPGDLATLALLVWPLWRSRAEALWARAARARVVRPFERAVVGGMDVDDAAKRLTVLDAGKMSPLNALAVMRVREGVHRASGRMFVRAVLSGDEGDSVYDAEKEAREEDERRCVIDAGRSMGGPCAELVGLLEHVATGVFIRHEDVLPSYGEDEEEMDETERAARVLLGALVVYRRLFPSSLGGGALPVILSPPPSPSRRNAGLRSVLRVALDSDVFDRGPEGEGAGELEDARDLVVDMLVDADRAGRRVRL